MNGTTLAPAMQRLKKELLAHYATKEPYDYRQYDAMIGVEIGEDCHVVPDSDGDCIMSGHVAELRNGNVAVRVQILDGTDPLGVSRVLRKILNWIEGTDPLPVHPHDDDSYLSQRQAQRTS